MYKWNVSSIPSQFHAAHFTRVADGIALSLRQFSISARRLDEEIRRPDRPVETQSPGQTSTAAPSTPSRPGVREGTNPSSRNHASERQTSDRSRARPSSLYPPPVPTPDESNGSIPGSAQVAFGRREQNSTTLRDGSSLPRGDSFSPRGGGYSLRGGSSSLRGDRSGPRGDRSSARGGGSSSGGGDSSVRPRRSNPRGDRLNSRGGGYGSRGGGYGPRGGGYSPRGGGYSPRGGGHSPRGGGSSNRRRSSDPDASGQDSESFDSFEPEDFMMSSSRGGQGRGRGRGQRGGRGRGRGFGQARGSNGKYEAEEPLSDAELAYLASVKAKERGFEITAVIEDVNLDTLAVYRPVIATTEGGLAEGVEVRKRILAGRRCEEWISDEETAERLLNGKVVMFAGEKDKDRVLQVAESLAEEGVRVRQEEVDQAEQEEKGVELAQEHLKRAEERLAAGWAFKAIGDEGRRDLLEKVVEGRYSYGQQENMSSDGGVIEHVRRMASRNPTIRPAESRRLVTKIAEITEKDRERLKKARATKESTTKGATTKPPRVRKIQLKS